MRVLNFKMISHPMNWLTVMLMVAIAGAIGHYTLSLLGVEPTTKNKKSSYDEMPSGQSPGEVASGAIDPQGSSQLQF
jgi:hypothetical protein